MVCRTIKRLRFNVLPSRLLPRVHRDPLETPHAPKSWNNTKTVLLEDLLTASTNALYYGAWIERGRPQPPWSTALRTRRQPAPIRCELLREWGAANLRDAEPGEAAAR